MPSYGDLPSGVGSTGQGATDLHRGVSLKLFNAETPQPPQASIACSIPPGPAAPSIVFDIEFAGASATDSLLIQAASVDVDSAYQTVFTSTNKNQDVWHDTNGFQFYRAKLVTQSAGGALTVTVRNS